MAKSENKTKPQKTSVKDFLVNIGDEQMRKDAAVLSRLFEKVSGEKPVMWGDTIVGYGNYHYKYDSGREGDFFVTGFSPRKGNISLYTNCYLNENDPLLKSLGKIKHGKSCIYVRKLDDIDLAVLEKLIAQGIDFIKKKYPG
jgi:hypothetical protein